MRDLGTQLRVIGTWLRADGRRRLLSLAVLALLVGLAGGTVGAAAAGARRGASAIGRLWAETKPATVAVLPNQPGFDWRRVEALPEVAGVSTFVVDYNAALAGLPESVATFPPANDQVLRTVEKPVVYAGRVFNPRRLEAVVTRQYVATFHRGVGSSVTVLLPSRRQVYDANSPPPSQLAGPRVRLRVVGVIRSPWYVDGPHSPGTVLVSPAVEARYPAYVIGNQHDPANPNYINALVRLRGGEAAIPQLRRDITRVTGRANIDIWDLRSQDAAYQHQISFESRCLLALAGAALLASAFLIGQALARYASASAADLQVLRGLGVPPWLAVACVAAGPAIAGLAGAGLAVALAFGVSPWFPIGTASVFEPAPGASADWIVLGPGAAAIAVLVGAGAVAAGYAAVRAAAHDRPARRSAIAAALAQSGARTPVVIGARYALEPGRGRAAVPVRPALIGAVTGVLGVVAALTFAHAVSATAANPARFGQTFQYGAFTGFSNHDFGPTGKLIAVLDRLRSVTGVDDARTDVATTGGGADSVSLFSYQRGSKPVPVVVFSGHMPRGPGQVLLAPRTLAALHAHVGSRVRLSGSAGTRVLAVAGAGLVPEGPHNSYADGGWLTPAGYKSLFTGFKFDIVLVTLTPAARGAGAGAALAAQVTRQAPELKGMQFSPAQVPQEVSELNEVKTLPLVLGIFLALLAAAAVGHALVTVARRRAADIAILRTMGMTGGQCRLILATQSTVLAVAGLIFGVPIGLIIGRLLWRAVADYTPVQYVPPFALWLMLAVGPVTLVLANLIAAWPARSAARLRVAQVLRTE